VLCGSLYCFSLYKNICFIKQAHLLLLAIVSKFGGGGVGGLTKAFYG
jgi:hypothetical protein